ncbi:MAG: hypothetical protein PUK66_04835 [Bacteroidales bacterium]|uniref:hypothetical protein n=1 Tax=Porphyromonas sp. TaxID=1924944 RepID=UPI002971F94B|nr:hypothetical protein [Porphyromonas sp.]MDD7438151.1 hypothetical protein [Bacteroidales bacterium]MDY3066798.1 hypothetical protein [Porphyromonas sp.]
MRRKSAERINRLSALLMLTVMVWLGGALVAHTLSHHHLHDHLHAEAHSGDMEDEQCMLLVFVSSPFSVVAALDVPDAAYVGSLVLGIDCAATLFSGQSVHPSLRAPPIC